MDILLQLYSIREKTAEDFAEAVKKVGEIGYDGVEFAGYGGLNSAQMSDLLKESGLYSVGSHTSFEIFQNSFDEELAYHRALGSKYIICPGTKLETLEDIQNAAEVFNAAAQKAAPYGIKVGYHNHHREFEKIDGQYILDLLAQQTDDNVILELDVYWAKYAEVDPFWYIQKWGKKIELIHLKQIGQDKKNVDMPDGIIDMKKVMDTAKYATYFIVEQEHSDKDIWDSVKINVDYLKSL